jgi:hypothetical protein
MGHKSIQMTCGYAHVAPKHELAAVEKLAGFSETPSTAKPTDTTTGTLESSEEEPIERE